VGIIQVGNIANRLTGNLLSGMKLTNYYYLPKHLDFGRKNLKVS